MIDILYPKPAEKIILVALMVSGNDKLLFNEDLVEMEMLCKTAGAEIVATVIQKLSRPNPATYIGSGKLKEIANTMREKYAESIIIDAELSPAQIRNIEKIIKGKVIDRGQLILDIFANHARTNEARIQVELAQLITMYPRLTHAWSHFSKQVGGIGTRGPGEKQLEVDRRLVQKKISDLKKRLTKIEKSRVTQRRSRRNEYKVALVGYTNVGKSTLLNAMSGSDVLVENKLFATLDTSTRKVFLPDINDSVVISDTVGFLRKLPHDLVASFRSTLEVVKEADIIILVMDASSSYSSQQLTAVNEVLDELGEEGAERIMVFNKSDFIEDDFIKKQIRIEYPGAFLLSAFNFEDILKLKKTIALTVKKIKEERIKESLIKQRTKLLYG